MTDQEKLLDAYLTGVIDVETYLLYKEMLEEYEDAYERNLI